MSDFHIPPKLTEVRGGRIYSPEKDGDGFQIADSGGWLPGSYDNFDTAKLALHHRSKDNWSMLQRLNDKIFSRYGEDRLITTEDIRKELKELKSIL
ncbi:TPA: hypothetical protein ACSIVU_001045 [Acinetobacter baumannii]